MKFKYPKKIIVGSTEFKIIYNYKIGGAKFSYPHKKAEGFVEFGMAEHKVNPLIFLEYVIHEFKEIIHIQQGTRFHNNADDAYQFHYLHREHEDMCSRLAGILDKFIK